MKVFTGSSNPILADRIIKALNTNPYKNYNEKKLEEYLYDKLSEDYKGMSRIVLNEIILKNIGIIRTRKDMLKQRNEILAALDIEDSILHEIEKDLTISPLKLGSMKKKRFSDGEIWVKFNENIRGKHVFIIQSTNPPAENIIELLIMIDAAKRASARHITAVIPYFGYSRQDRKDQPRVSITAKLMANMITGSGADRILAVDLHADQIQGFFDIPLDNLNAFMALLEPIKKQIPLENLTLVAPDIGSAKRVSKLSEKLGNLPIAILVKKRPSPNKAFVEAIIGSVRGRDLLICDDIIDTSETLVKGVKFLKNKGAGDISAACVHPILSGQAYKKIEDSCLKKLYVTDTIPLKKGKPVSKIEVISVAELIAKAIEHIHEGQSISNLFEIPLKCD